MTSSLTWQIVDADKVSLDSDPHDYDIPDTPQKLIEDLKVSPAVSTKYTLTATRKEGGKKTDTRTITVNPVKVDFFNADPDNIDYGENKDKIPV